MAYPRYITLFQNATANGNSSTLPLNFTDEELELQVFGVFGGANVTFWRIAVDGSTAIQERDRSQNLVSITSTQNVPMTIPFGDQGFANIANASGTTNLTVLIKLLGHAHTTGGV